MSAVATSTSTVLILKDNRLIWSAQTPFPVHYMTLCETKLATKLFLRRLMILIEKFSFTYSAIALRSFLTLGEKEATGFDPVPQTSDLRDGS